MQMMEIGTFVERSCVQGFNVYEVTRVLPHRALLKCRIFVADEDLGDKIMCTRASQEIWVAQYHAVGFTSTHPDVLTLSGLTSKRIG